MKLQKNVLKKNIYIYIANEIYNLIQYSDNVGNARKFRPGFGKETFSRAYTA